MGRIAAQADEPEDGTRTGATCGARGSARHGRLGALVLVATAGVAAGMTTEGAPGEPAGPRVVPTQGSTAGAETKADGAERFLYAHSLRGLGVESAEGSEGVGAEGPPSGVADIESLRPLLVSMAERRLLGSPGRVEAEGDELRVVGNEGEHLAISALLDAFRTPPPEPCSVALTVLERSSLEPTAPAAARLPAGDAILTLGDHRALLRELRREGLDVRESRATVPAWIESPVGDDVAGADAQGEGIPGGRIVLMPTEGETCGVRARFPGGAAGSTEERILALELSMHGAAWFSLRGPDGRDLLVSLRVMPPESWVRSETSFSVAPWIGRLGSSPEASGLPFAHQRTDGNRSRGGDDFEQRRRDLLAWLEWGGFDIRPTEASNLSSTEERRVPGGPARRLPSGDPFDAKPRAEIDDEGRLHLRATDSELDWVRGFLERNRPSSGWVAWVELAVWEGPRSALEGRLDSPAVLSSEERDAWTGTLEDDPDFTLEGEPTFGVPTLGLSRIQNLRERDFLVGYRATQGGRVQKPVIDTQIVGLDLSVRPAWPNARGPVGGALGSTVGGTVDGARGGSQVGIALHLEESGWENPIVREETPHGPIDVPVRIGARASGVRFLGSEESLALWIPTGGDRVRLVLARAGFRRR